MSRFRTVIHRFRNYVRPGDYAGYRKTVRLLRGRGAPADVGRTALFDLNDPLIDTDKGRYAFGLVREFIDAGYSIYLAPSFRFLSSVHRKPFKRLLVEQPVHLYEGSGRRSRLTLLVTDRDTSPYSEDCEHSIRLDYRSRLHRTRDLVLFPYRQHPWFNLDPSLPSWPDLGDDERPVPVSFFGNWTHPDYDNTRALAEFGVHGRRDLIGALLAGLDADQIYVAERGSSPETAGAGKLVLGSAQNRPDMPGYARALRRSNFFICGPGTGYPLCHNLVESLLLGCIPIVERPELTGLPLVAGESCLAFEGPSGLVDVVRQCLEDAPSRAPAMRASLRDVVREHLEPGAFVRSLDVEHGRLPESVALLWFERDRR